MTGVTVLHARLVQYYIWRTGLLIQKLGSAQSPWSNDSTGAAFRTRGYEMDGNDRPAFLYSIYGADITDDVKALDNGEGLRRTLTLKNAVKAFMPALQKEKQ
jgi:hypothetical protein